MCPGAGQAGAVISVRMCEMRETVEEKHRTDIKILRLNGTLKFFAS